MSRLSQQHPDDLFGAIVSFHEQFLGWNAYIAKAKKMALRIAAVALSRSMTVLTRNTSDFLKVPVLKVEDWAV